MTQNPSEQRRRLSVALVGPDIGFLNTGGGTAAVSLRIVRYFEDSPEFEVSFIRNYYSLGLWRRLTAAMSAIWKVWSGRKKFDVVHVQVTGGGLGIERDLPLAVVASLSGIRVLTQYHFAQIREYESGNRVHRWCYKQLLRVSDEVLVLGPNSEKWVRGMAGVEKSVRVVGNCADTVDCIEQTESSTARFLFAGRLDRQKGIYDLLDALASLAASGVEFSADIAGDGELDRVSELVRQNSWLRGRVNVLGWRSEEEIQDLLTESWALVLPSYSEGMPLVVLEAMGCGRAVVATRVNEVEEVVLHEETGLLVEPGDIEGIRAAMERLAGDRSLTEKMGRRGWEHLRHEFTEQKMMDKLSAAWRSVCTRQGLDRVVLRLVYVAVESRTDRVVVRGGTVWRLVSWASPASVTRCSDSAVPGYSVFPVTPTELQS